MPRFIVLIVAVLVLFASSCEEESAVPEKAAEVAQKASDTLAIPALKGLKPELRLTKEAAMAVENWDLYNNLSVAIDSLSGNTMGELRPRIERIAQIFEEQENAEEAEAPTTPETVRTKAIQSRVLAIETQHNILQNNSNRNTPNIDQVAVAIVNLKNGLQHLNLQLNERFSVSIREMLEEIKNEDGDASIDLDIIQPNSAQ